MLSNWYTSNEEALFTQFQYNGLQTESKNIQYQHATDKKHCG